MTTKTPAKKAVAKKTATKKIVKKSVTIITRVPAELAFWTVDGQVYHTLLELADGLHAMEGRVYRYHADKDHQDFATWVGMVFHDKVAAKALKLATTQKAAEKIIRLRIATHNA